MKVERVYTDLVSFKSITKCDVQKSVNGHGKAVIAGMINKEEDILGKMKDVTWASIYAEGEQGETESLFSGVVESLSVYDENGTKMCDLTLVGGTRLMDIEKKTKTFQDASQTYCSVIEYLNKSHEASFIAEDLVNQSIDNFYVQYKETDWDYLIRLASNIHACIIPDYKVKKIHYYVGLQDKGKDFYCDTVEYTQRKEINCLRDYSGNSIRNSEVDEVVLFKHREMLELGDKVKVSGSTYYIYKIQSEWKGSELIHSYELRRKDDFELKQIYNFMAVGASLDAVVIGVEKSQVKIKADVDEIQELATARLFPYSSVFSSPDGTGWYCMPEEGDRVRLYFPSEKENDAYVISSVHVDEMLGESSGRSNPDNKSIMNKFNKQIELTPTKISLSSNPGMSLVIEDEKGITITSDKNISLVASDNVEIVSMENYVEIAASEEMKLIQNSSEIKLDGDITITGGQLHLQN